MLFGNCHYWIIPIPFLKESQSIRVLNWTNGL